MPCQGIIQIANTCFNYLSKVLVPTNILQPFLGIVDFDNLITSFSYTQELN